MIPRECLVLAPAGYLPQLDSTESQEAACEFQRPLRSDPSFLLKRVYMYIYIYNMYIYIYIYICRYIYIHMDYN